MIEKKIRMERHQQEYDKNPSFKGKKSTHESTQNEV